MGCSPPGPSDPGFSRPESWSGQPLCLGGIFPPRGSTPSLPALAPAGGLSTTIASWESPRECPSPEGQSSTRRNPRQVCKEGLLNRILQADQGKGSPSGRLSQLEPQSWPRESGASSDGSLRLLPSETSLSSLLCSVCLFPSPP